MKQKAERAKQKTKRQPANANGERIGGGLLFVAGLFLLLHCLYHQKNDAVQYPWGTSPYLSPVILAGLLMVLSLVLLLRKEEERK